eukprot:7378738-Pyramimonas_sp.AAC.1
MIALRSIVFEKGFYSVTTNIVHHGSYHVISIALQSEDMTTVLEDSSGLLQLRYYSATTVLEFYSVTVLL